MSGGYDSVLKIWDVATGEVVRELLGHWGAVRTARFSPDGSRILSGGMDNQLILWDTASGKAIHQLKGHDSWVLTADFSPDGQRAISGGSDGTTRLWDLKHGLPICSIMADSQGEYLFWTPDGYFDGSKDSSQFLGIVKGMEIFEIDQFANRFNRPDILLERLGSPDQELRQHFYHQYRKRLRKLGLKEEQLSAEIHVPQAHILEQRQDGKFLQLDLRLADSRVNLKHFNIYVNGIPLFGAYGRPVGSRDAKLAERIELTRGENKIEVSCTNAAGAESYRAVTYARYDGQAQGDLYYLGFGVSRYQNPKLNLQYAHKDAQDLGQLLGKMQGPFRQVHALTLLDEQATVKNIRQAKAFLKQAKVDDTFVLFIAGHGMHDRDAEATYYYLTHETDLGRLKATAADFELIEELLQGVPPRQKLFLMDTCESGEVEEELETQSFLTAASRGVKPRTARGVELVADLSAPVPPRRLFLTDQNRYIYNDLLRRSGAIVFSGSRGGEFSYEPAAFDEHENGFFTRALLDSLRTPAADVGKDGWVSTLEMRNFVTRSVAERSQGLQNPTVDRDNPQLLFAFPVIK